MVKLIDILSEIQIKKQVPNNLDKLLHLQSQLNSTKDLKVKQQLALQCATLVLPIYEFHYPKDHRVRDSLKLLKQFLETGDTKLRDEARSLAWSASAAA